MMFTSIHVCVYIGKRLPESFDGPAREPLLTPGQSTPAGTRTTVSGRPRRHNRAPASAVGRPIRAHPRPPKGSTCASRHDVVPRCSPQPPPPPPSSPEPSPSPPPRPRPAPPTWSAGRPAERGHHRVRSAATTTVTSASALTTALGSTSAAVSGSRGPSPARACCGSGSNKTILGTRAGPSGGLRLQHQRRPQRDHPEPHIQELGRRRDQRAGVGHQHPGSTTTALHRWLRRRGDIKRGKGPTSSRCRGTGWSATTRFLMLLGHSDDNAAETRGHTSYDLPPTGSTRAPSATRGSGSPTLCTSTTTTTTTTRGYGVASTMSAGVLVEGNYFENVKDTYHLGEGGLRAGQPWWPATTTSSTRPPARPAAASTSIPYPYTLDSASSVKSIVTGGAGAGRISV